MVNENVHVCYIWHGKVTFYIYALSINTYNSVVNARQKNDVQQQQWDAEMDEDLSGFTSPQFPRGSEILL